MGNKIDKKGLHTSESRIGGILNVERPKNVIELKSFLRMVNYKEKFIRNISSVLYPLHQLLERGVKWFLLVSTEVLAHFPESELR